MAGAATPTIVPLRRLGGELPAPAEGAPAPTPDIGLAAGGAPEPEVASRIACMFGGAPCMSIVPLNLGAALFSANPHFVQVEAVSGFCVPQFGQNKTLDLRYKKRRHHSAELRES